MKPLPSGATVSKCKVIHSGYKLEQGPEGEVAFPISKRIKLNIGYRYIYHYNYEKDDSTSISFSAPGAKYDCMIACLQAHFTNTATTVRYQLYFKDKPELRDLGIQYPDRPTSEFFWKEIESTPRTVGDYTKDEGHIIYCKTRGHDCDDCRESYFQNGKAPRQPEGLKIPEEIHDDANN